MVKVIGIAALLLAGCGANVGTDGIDAGARQDARAIDAFVARPDAAPACPNGRRVYLEFEGAALTQGTPSDATVNRVSWMGNASATIPPYKAGDGDRLTLIQTITDEVKFRLSGLPLEVVTQRPATGPYVMVVFGGTNALPGTQYTYATNEHDCDDVVKNDVGWVSDIVPDTLVADMAVGSIGWGLGLNGSTSPDSCLCSWAGVACTDSANACTIGTNVPTETSEAPATTCPNQNPQNEAAAFSTGFCQL